MNNVTAEEIEMANAVAGDKYVCKNARVRFIKALRDFNRHIVFTVTKDKRQIDNEQVTKIRAIFDQVKVVVNNGGLTTLAEEIDETLKTKAQLQSDVKKLNDQISFICRAKKFVLEDEYKNYKFSVSKSPYFTSYDKYDLAKFKSLVFTMRSVLTNYNGDSINGINHEKFLNMAEQIAYAYGLFGVMYSASEVSDIKSEGANKILENIVPIMAAFMESIYRCELEDYLKDKAEIEKRMQELDDIYKQKFEDWKVECLEKEKEKITSELHQKTNIVSKWIDELNVDCEAAVTCLFGRFYEMLGFSAIKKMRVRYPDCIVMKGEKELRIELEYLSSNFIAHGHDPSQVDLVVCWVKDKELPVPVIVLKDELERLGVIAKGHKVY